MYKKRITSLHKDNTFIKTEFCLPTAPLHVKLQGVFTGEERQGRWLLVGQILSTGTSLYNLGRGPTGDITLKAECDMSVIL